LAEQVGVKAPGTENKTIFLLEKCFPTSIFTIPSGPRHFNIASGILSPTFKAIKPTPIINI
jgi:hypothetical protein